MTKRPTIAELQETISELRAQNAAVSKSLADAVDKLTSRDAALTEVRRTLAKSHDMYRQLQDNGDYMRVRRANLRAAITAFVGSPAADVCRWLPLLRSYILRLENALKQDD